MFLTNSGSEANDLALRLAQAHTGGRDMLVLDHAYHGNLTSLVDLSPYKFNGRGGRGCPPTTHVVPIPDAYRGGLGAEPEPYVSAVRALLGDVDGAGRQVAGFISEPMPGTAGQVVLVPGFLGAAYDAVRAVGGVCIADEVQIGFGRVGSHLWGFELHGVVPDIVTMGKPIGNGHPMGAVVTTPEVARSFANGMEYFNTFGGNPVSARVGLAVLDVIEDEGLQAHAARLGAQLLDGLSGLAARHEVIGDVRGHGLFVGVELVSDRSTKEPAGDVADRVADAMRDRGVLVSTDGPHHNVLKIKPPLVITTGRRRGVPGRPRRVPHRAVRLRRGSSGETQPGRRNTVLSGPSINGAQPAARPARGRGAKLAVSGFAAAGIGLVLFFVLVITMGVLGSQLGTPDPGHPGQFSLHGPLALIGGLLLVLCLLAVPVGLVVGVLGVAIHLSTRSARLEAAHDQVVYARETAHTAEQVAVAQATPVPGQWARAVFATYRWWIPALAAVLLAWLGLGRAAVFCVALQVAVLAVRVTVRWINGRTGGVQTIAVPIPASAVRSVGPERSAAVRAVAEAAGWTYVGTPSSTTGWTDLSTHNVCTGQVDGQPFTLHDAIVTVTAQLGGGAPVTHEIPVKTMVELNFPAVFELGVVPATESHRTGVAMIGPTVDLESAEFAQRYRVYCDDPIRGRMVMNPALMALVLASSYPIEIFIQRSVIQLITPDVLVGAEDLGDFVALAGRLRASAISATAHVEQ